MSDGTDDWIAMIQENITDRLRYLMIPLNILAKEAGVSFNGWQGIRFIRGYRHNVDLYTFDTIAMVLKTKPADLLRPDYSPNHISYEMNMEDIGISNEKAIENLHIYDRKLRYKLNSGRQLGIRLRTLYRLAQEENVDPSTLIS